MWELPKEKTQAIYKSIVELVLSHIKSGQLLPGEKLPPERQLANLFNVNRSTVVHALAELEAMGVVIRKQGSGTMINDGRWGIYTGGRTNWRRYLAQGSFNQEQPYYTKLMTLAKQEDTSLIDAFTGELPLNLVPELALPSISWNDFLSQESQQDALGYLPLREQVSQLLKDQQGLELPTEQLLITSGAQQALFLLIQVLLQNGDGVAIEEPSSFYPLSIFQAAGVRLYGVPVDQDGMRVELLEPLIQQRKIKLVLVNPNSQNPTGTTMSLARRQQLIALCQSYQLPIVEDDVLGQLSFKTVKQPPLLKELDQENVIYIGSLSKIMGATTKIGWLSAPIRVTQKLAEARQEMDFTVSIFPQVLAYSALKQPQFTKELTKLQEKLKLKMTVFIALIEEKLVPHFSYYQPSGGYFIWLTNRQRQLTPKDYEQLLTEKLLVLPGFLMGSDSQSFRLNIARLSMDEQLKVVAIIKKNLC